MKTIKNISFAASLLAMMFIVSCSDNDDFNPGEQPQAGFQEFAFCEDQNLQLAPEDPTTVTLTATRVDSLKAADVPIEVLVNDDSVFVVPATIHFNEGDSVANFDINFPNAEVGKTYKLTIAVNDPKYTCEYSTSKSVTVTLVRVKWNDVGYYLNNAGAKIEGYVMFTEDFLTTFYGVQNIPYPVRMQERADRPGYYRLVNPFGAAYRYNDAGDWDDSKNYYMYINATNPEKVYIERYNSEMSWKYGQFIFHSLAGYYLERDRADLAEEYFGKIENGSITFPASSLLIAMTGYNNGGLYTANTNGAFKIVIDPSLNLYEANVDDDFDYEALWDGQIVSQVLNGKREISVLKGVCKTTTDSCDVRFAEEFGTPYIIQGAFADDFDLLFCAKDDGTISIPKGYESQPTGLKAPYGKDIYANINASASTWTGEYADLRITFTDESLADTFGVSNEKFEHITWKVVNTGTYTYSDTFFAEEGTTAEDPGLPLYVCEQDPTKFYIEHWGFNVPLYFEYDAEMEYVELYDNYVGYDYGDYGPVYITDAADNFKPSYFDAETNTFYFNVNYFLPEYGNYSFGNFAYETFCIDGSTAPETETKARSPRRHLQVKRK